MNAPRLRCLAALAAVLLGTGCGNKGPLFLPGENPAVAGPQPAASAGAEAEAGAESESAAPARDDERDPGERTLGR